MIARKILAAAAMLLSVSVPIVMVGCGANQGVVHNSTEQSATHDGENAAEPVLMEEDP